MKKDCVLITGASGQIGTELTLKLREAYGNDNVVTADIKPPVAEVLENGPHEELNILDTLKLAEIVDKYQVTQIYHLAAILSAKGEQAPRMAWDVNMNGLISLLEIVEEKGVQKVFWPSSIAVFGKRTPKEHTPQHTITDPQTIYGISKLAGERWCHYYHHNKGLDIRSLRYPGLISYKTEPGGGTTDYAVEIFYEAIKHGRYSCFLREDARLPMMYMPDAIRGTIELMEAPADQLSVHSSYNVSAISFTPEQLTAAIQQHLPELKVDYKPDFRQQIADFWPASIDDTIARDDWNWQPEYDLEKMTVDMLMHIRQKLEVDSPC